MQNLWSLRVKLFLQRVLQPTFACMTCMPGSLGNIWSLLHWTIALRTGAVTGLLAVLLSFTPAARLFQNRCTNALVVGCLTAFGDAYSHAGHYGFQYAEAALTGFVSGLLALVGSFLLEDRARRLRTLWARIRG